MKRLLKVFGLIGLIVVVLAFAVPIHAATTNTITITTTPAFISIATAVNTWAPNGITGSGFAAPNTTYYSNPGGDTVAPSSTVVDGECRFTTVNTSTIPIDLTLNIPDTTGGDASTNSNLGTNGATTFGAYSYVSGALLSAKVIVKASASDPMKVDLAATTNIKWGIQIKTQSNAWASGTAMVAVAQLSAVAH